MLRSLVFLSVLAVVTACSETPQSVSAETVAAFEVALPDAQERADLLATLADAAKAEGAHVDSQSDEELRATGEAMPEAKMSIHAAVWRGSEDEDSWAVIMDRADHLGEVWIMFLRGNDEKSASRFREQAIRQIKARWPNTLTLPIIDRRTVPLRSDLLRTPTGYRLNPLAASRYGVIPAVKG